MTTIKLLDAQTYQEMGQKARRDARVLMDQADRTFSDLDRVAMYKRAQTLLGEAIELEMRRIAVKRGETDYVLNTPK